jgi:hypothetical protein
MNNEPHVEIVSEPGIKRQFGKGRLSFQKMSKRSSLPDCDSDHTRLYREAQERRIG